VSALFILVPLFSVITLNLPFRNMMKKLAPGWLATVCCVQAAAVAGFILRKIGCCSVAPCPFSASLQLDKPACVVLLAAGLIVGAALSVGVSLLKDEEKTFNFVNLLFIALAGLNGVALVTDIFSLYVFIEITAVASYILIAFHKERYAMEAAFKYIILSAIASVLMLSAIALLLFFSGTTSFAALRQALTAPSHGGLVMLALAMFLCGAFIKGGLMPFHGWLPDVYASAPAPVSIFLAGIVTKTLGAFVLIRLAVSVIDFNGPLGQVALFVGALSIVAGALAALGQTDLKRMLAFSSISQVGYIVLGVGAGSALGIVGALLHLFNHSVFKSTLFINSAAIESRAGTRDMSRLSGIGRRMPVTMVTAALSWLSASGIPPLAGFWSKLLIVMALWAAGHYAYAVIAVAASILTLAYFLPLQRQVFQGIDKEEFAAVREAGAGVLLPACVLSAITVALGLWLPFWIRLLKF
jgi:proton-translocating NADH-quinone oxidoreductase chain N